MRCSDNGCLFNVSGGWGRFTSCIARQIISLVKGTRGTASIGVCAETLVDGTGGEGVEE